MSPADFYVIAIKASLTKDYNQKIDKINDLLDLFSTHLNELKIDEDVKFDKAQMVLAHFSLLTLILTLKPDDIVHYTNMLSESTSEFIDDMLNDE